MEKTVKNPEEEQRARSREIRQSEDLLLALREVINNVNQFGDMPPAELTTMILLRRMIEEKGYAGPTELKKSLKLSTPAVSRMLHTLENKGYLTRNTSKEDHRFVMVGITPKGEECLSKEITLFRDLFMKTARRMGTQKMLVFLDCINDFTGILREEIRKT